MSGRRETTASRLVEWDRERDAVHLRERGRWALDRLSPSGGPIPAPEGQPAPD